MAVSIDRWAPGEPKSQSRRRLQSKDPRRDRRRSHSQRLGESSPLQRTPMFSASRALCVWLACGLVLTLTCPPISAAQTWFGALPLWLVGLPAASLVALTLGIARR